MNTLINFKAASFNAADLFGTMTAVTVGGTPLAGGGTTPAATGAGATETSLPPALPGMRATTARPLFADALGDAAHAARPAAGAPAKTDEPEQPPADGVPALLQEIPLPSMAAPWLSAQVTAAPAQHDTDGQRGNDMAAPATIIPAEPGAAPVAAPPATTAPFAATLGTAAPAVTLAAASAPVAAPATAAISTPAVATVATAPAMATLVAAPATATPLAAAVPAATVAATPETANTASPHGVPAGAPHDMAASNTPAAVRPVAMQFNAQLGTLVPAPQLGEPLAAAMPAPAGETETAAPAARGKAMRAAVEAPVIALQPVVAATFIPVITPVAVATFAPGSVPAAPAAHTDDLAASAIPSASPAVAPAVPGRTPPRAQSAGPAVTAAAFEPATAPAAAPGAPAAAVLPAPPASNPIAADIAVNARPALRPQAAQGDTAAMPAKASTVGASFAAPVASSLDAERNVAATTAAVTPATGLGLTAPVVASTLPAQGGDIIKLNGTAQQWQEPLREALGERLQTQIGRNSEHAVIRLDPPMLGRIDISIRHTAGMLQVNLSASNTEVLRQLQGIGETMRTDLAQRQYTDVAVNISATPRSPAAQTFAEGDARGQRQPGRQQDEAEPGRALSDGTPAGAPYGATFAMHEREYN